MQISNYKEHCCVECGTKTSGGKRCQKCSAKRAGRIRENKYRIRDGLRLLFEGKINRRSRPVERAHSIKYRKRRFQKVNDLRGRNDVMISILKCCKHPKTKQQIKKKVNLDIVLVSVLLEKLVQFNLLRTIGIKGFDSSYLVTDSGKKAIRVYDELEKCLWVNID